MPVFSPLVLPRFVPALPLFYPVLHFTGNIRQKDIDRIVADQARLRENMKALKGSSEEKALIQRYTSQLDQQETQLESLRETIQDTEAQRDKANDELENMLDHLDLEATL